MTTKAVQSVVEKWRTVDVRSDLAGRLRNIGKLKNWLMAVAEAITNSLDSLSQAGRAGKIEVELKREKPLLPDQTRGPVTQVLIKDDGTGFTDENFSSFCTPDSLLKHRTGGKGLGRLMCLQAFERVEVLSQFEQADEWLLREAILQCEAPCIRDSLDDAPAQEWSTQVTLSTLRPHHHSAAQKSLEQIVEWLSEHFIGLLVEKPAWLKAIVISEGKRSLDLTAAISGRLRWSESFQISGYQFDARCYEVSGKEGCDMVRFVASRRVVPANTRDLEHYIPHLVSIASDRSHSILVKSAFFDEHVNDARNGIPFSDDGEEGGLCVTAAAFREGLGDALKTRLKDIIDKSEDSFKSHITEVVKRDAPYLRLLLGAFFAGREFRSLSRSAKADEILASLDAFKRRDAQALKHESKRLAKLKTETAGYWESAETLAAQIDVQKKVALAEYVSLRKIVLERLQQLIDANEMGLGHREAAIHNLIFPMRTDTESMPAIDHQLWIVDERLESHAYLASDQPIDGKAGNRPDLLALDRVGAFAPEPSSISAGYDRIVLVEFKKALRDLATAITDELPHRQMMRYAAQIVDEKAKVFGTKRPIKITSNARFYMYAVCEMSGGLMKRLIRDEGFKPTPTGDGAFAVSGEGSYYMEYISLPKLLDDANARNHAFFRRLGLE